MFRSARKKVQPPKKEENERNSSPNFAGNTTTHPHTLLPLPSCIQAAPRRRQQQQHTPTARKKCPFVTARVSCATPRPPGKTTLNRTRKGDDGQDGREGRGQAKQTRKKQKPSLPRPDYRVPPSIRLGSTDGMGGRRGRKARSLDDFAPTNSPASARPLPPHHHHHSNKTTHQHRHTLPICPDVCMSSCMAMSHRYIVAAATCPSRKRERERGVNPCDTATSPTGRDADRMTCTR